MELNNDNIIQQIEDMSRIGRYKKKEEEEENLPEVGELISYDKTIFKRSKIALRQLKAECLSITSFFCMLLICLFNEMIGVIPG